MSSIPDSLDPARLLHRRHGENFAVSAAWIPRRERRLLLAVYAYARFVDELGDSGLPGVMQALDAVEQDVQRGGSAPHRVPALAPVLRTLHDAGLPSEPLTQLVEANRLDQRVTRYRTFDELLGYCRLSANPVGRLVLCIMDVPADVAGRLSDDVCSALQVVEHLQDVREDAMRGRIYVPAEDLEWYGVPEEALQAALPSPPGLRRVVALEAARAEAMLTSGSELVGMLRGWRRAAVAGYVAGGMAALHALEAAGWDVTGRHPRPRIVRRAAETFSIAMRGGAA